MQSFARAYPRRTSLSKKALHFAAVRDASKARVLARDAHAGVTHHEHQEARLTLGEAEFGDGLDAILRCHQSHNSSANPPLRPPPLPPPLRPPMRRLIPR